MILSNVAIDELAETIEDCMPDLAFFLPLAVQKIKADLQLREKLQEWVDKHGN